MLDQTLAMALLFDRSLLHDRRRNRRIRDSEDDFYRNAGKWPWPLRLFEGPQRPR